MTDLISSQNSLFVPREAAEKQKAMLLLFLPGSFHTKTIALMACLLIQTLHRPSAREEALLIVRPDRLRALTDQDSSDQFCSLMYLQVAVTSVDTQSFWSACQRTSLINWGSNGSANLVHLPLIPRCGGFSKYCSKSNCYKNKWDQNWQISRKPHLDTKWDKGKEVAVVWTGCFSSGVQGHNNKLLLIPCPCTRGS